MIAFGLFYKYFTIMTILAYIFYIDVFIYIINKYESPEFKLPWVIILMLFFVMGAFVFILFLGNEENKKIAKEFEKTKMNLEPFLKQDTTLEELKKENLDVYLQANYRKVVTGLPAYRNTKVNYCKIGEDFHKKC